MFYSAIDFGHAEEEQEGEEDGVRWGGAVMVMIVVAMAKVVARDMKGV